MKMSNISFFPNKPSSNSRYYDIENIIECATMNIDNDGGGTMGYVTNEKFDAKMEVIENKINNIDNKIDYAQDKTTSDIKLYMNKELKSELRWIIVTACTILTLVIGALQILI